MLSSALLCRLYEKRLSKPVILYKKLRQLLLKTQRSKANLPDFQVSGKL